MCESYDSFCGPTARLLARAWLQFKWHSRAVVNRRTRGLNGHHHKKPANQAHEIDSAARDLTSDVVRRDDVIRSVMLLVA